MAIKDQCLGCLSYNSNETCQRTGTPPSFDYHSCDNYKKKTSINLDKGSSAPVAQPSQPATRPTPMPTPKPTSPQAAQPINGNASLGRSMFAHPFSFEGRIRRTEYCLSYILYVIWYFIYMAVIESESIVLILLAIASLIPALWFFIAQSAKRCHDRDNSGWYQIIPLYFLWMMFAEGDHGTNSYGEDPKA